MTNEELKQRIVAGVLPHVQTPGQYVGGELNAVVKDPASVRGRLCLAFPDTYAIGMSNHGLQLLYHLMNLREDWACERVFSPWFDMAERLREQNLPLHSLETFSPVGGFDVVGFTLQHDLCYSNVLEMLDLAGIPLLGETRTNEHPLVIAGGPCVQNPEPMARFVDLFIIGDGEETLPQVCDAWIDTKSSVVDRSARLEEMARRLPHVYVPHCYEPPANGLSGPPCPALPDLPTSIAPAVVADLDAVPLPTRPIVPMVECVQERISLEIMRGCPWRCRFCQSTTTKRPLRFRKVETLLAAALESYRNTGLNEISLLSLSTSDYPDFDELVRTLQDTFQPLGVEISVPSLRVNERLRAVGGLLGTRRRSGLTLAPEAARQSMRRRIGKRISDDDLYEGCRNAFAAGFQRVKLYFMCGLPGETDDDLDGIIQMANRISRLGGEVMGHAAAVTANVSNFVPKPQTPFQRLAMQSREYFHHAREYLLSRKRLRSVKVKCHDVEASLLEGLLCRGDRRMGPAIEAAWRLGARFDAWSDRFQADLWRQAMQEAEIDIQAVLHQPRDVHARFPWDIVTILQGRDYLQREGAEEIAEPATGGN